jgi:hypothetical protein
MNKFVAHLKIWNLVTRLGETEAIKRLEGVQDPERRLVGDVAERITDKEAVEVRSGESAGVGEIGGAIELREIVSRKLSEARLTQNAEEWKSDAYAKGYLQGKVVALFDLQEWITDTDTERSDLSNASLSHGDESER